MITNKLSEKAKMKAIRRFMTVRIFLIGFILRSSYNFFFFISFKPYIVNYLLMTSKNFDYIFILIEVKLILHHFMLLMKLIIWIVDLICLNILILKSNSCWKVLYIVGHFKFFQTVNGNFFDSKYNFISSRL
jgi:hypothetical protein